MELSNENRLTHSPFEPYDPQRQHAKPFSKACEACFSRKVRCRLEQPGVPCTNCSTRGLVCRSRPRPRKRKGQTQGNSAREADNNKELTLSNPSRRPSEAPVSPAQHISELEELVASHSGCPSGPMVPEPGTNLDGDYHGVGLSLFINEECRSPPSLHLTETTADDHFENSSFVSRSVVLGHEFPNLDHSHGKEGRDRHRFLPTEIEVLQLYGAFSLPEITLRQCLIDTFFEKCWIWSPVMDLPLENSMKERRGYSLLSLQAMVLAGSIMHTDLPEISETSYYRVKALVQARYEREPLSIVSALILLQWYSPAVVEDVSLDNPRFWVTYAVGLAHQIGLHREPAKDHRYYKLRRRIWWSLYVIDCLGSAFEGKPRLIHCADCSVTQITALDFPPNSKASIFIYYVGIVEILSDLCQILVRNTKLLRNERIQIENRLQTYFQSLPDELRLYDESNRHRLFNFNVALLHLQILTTIIVLYHPRSVNLLSEDNVLSVLAADLCVEILKAIRVRGQLSSMPMYYSWHIFVIATTWTTCSRLQGMNKRSNEALDVLENILVIFATGRPTAAHSIRNIRAVRKSVAMHRMSSLAASPPPERVSTPALRDGETRLPIPGLLECCGPAAIRNYRSIVEIIRRDSRGDRRANSNGIVQNVRPILLPDQQLFVQPDNTGNIDQIDDLSIELYTPRMAEKEDDLWLRYFVGELELDTTMP